MTSRTMPRTARAPRRTSRVSVSRTKKFSHLDKERPEQGWFVFMLVLLLAVGITLIGFISYIVLIG